METVKNQKQIFSYSPSVPARPRVRDILPKFKNNKFLTQTERPISTNYDGLKVI